MSAALSIRHILSIPTRGLTHNECSFIEALLFTYVYRELKTILRNRYKPWFRLLKLTTEEEDTMLDSLFLRFLIEDTISTETYDLQGIARYTQYDIEVIEDVATGKNTTPSITLLQRILTLHQTARPELYETLRKKLIEITLVDIQNQQPVLV